MSYVVKEIWRFAGQEIGAILMDNVTLLRLPFEAVLLAILRLLPVCSRPRGVLKNLCIKLLALIAKAKLAKTNVGLYTIPGDCVMW